MKIFTFLLIRDNAAYFILQDTKVVRQLFSIQLH